MDWVGDSKVSFPWWSSEYVSLRGGPKADPELTGGFDTKEQLEGVALEEGCPGFPVGPVSDL